RLHDDPPQHPPGPHRPARRARRRGAVAAHGDLRVGRILVPDDGRRDAKLVLIGEAPGVHEEEEGKPFVGASGKRLSAWWSKARPTRTDSSVTTVVPSPPASIVKIPRGEMAEHRAALHQRLAALDGPVIVIPTGNIALHALTGERGITKWRGSILVARL